MCCRSFIVSFCALLFVSSPLFKGSADAQIPYQWSKSLLPGTYHTSVTDLDTDASGNVFVCGTYKGAVDFDPSAGTYYLTSVGTLVNQFLAKYDSDGNFEWAFSLANSSAVINSSFLSVRVDNAGDVYVSGSLVDQIDFDPGPGTYILDADNGFGFLAKYDTDGNFLWAMVLEGNGISKIYEVAFDDANNVYCAGAFTNSTDFDPGPGTFSLSSNGNNDLFLSKYDEDGNFLIAGAAGGSGVDIAYTIDLDDDNNIYIGGVFQDTVDFDLTPGTDYEMATGVYHGFVAKYNSSGALHFVLNLGDGTQTEVKTLVTSGSNRFYVGGIFMGDVDFDPLGAGDVISNDSMFFHAFVSAYDNYGLQQYTIPLHSDFANCVDLALDASGMVYAVGNFYYSMDFDPYGAGSVTTPVLYDGYLTSYDHYGNHIFKCILTGSSNQNMSAVDINSTDEVHLSGYYNSTVDFDFGAGFAYGFGGLSYQSAFIAKYGQPTILAQQSIQLNGLYEDGQDHLTWTCPEQQEGQFQIQTFLQGEWVTISDMQATTGTEMYSYYYKPEPACTDESRFYRIVLSRTNGTDLQSNPVSVNSPLFVQCYPSPVTTVVTLSGLPDDMQVILADQAGIPVLETTDHTIDVAWLPAGIYFVLNKQGEVLSRFVHE